MNLRELIVTVGLLLCALTNYGQITLKKYENQELRGQVESILFNTTPKAGLANGSSTQTTQKEYNIQENNPYNELLYPVSRISLNGAKIYSISEDIKLELEKNFNTDRESLNDAEEIFSDYAVNYTSTLGVLAYQQYLMYESGDILEKGRRSIIRIIDSNLSTVFENSYNTDTYDVVIDSSDKYLAYSYGADMHSSYPQQKGFKIIRIRDNYVVFDGAGIRATIKYSKFNYLCIAGFENNKEKLWLFDVNNEQLFLLGKKYRITGKSEFKYGKEILTNLQKYKVK